MGLAFAAGKFPQASQMILRAPLRDEHLALAKDEAGRDFNCLAAVQRPMLL
jgi:hypothetical protein